MNNPTPKRTPLRSDDHYVLLLPEMADEQFLTRAELLLFLEKLLQEYPHLVDRDLAKFPSPAAQAQRLLETACSVDIEQGQSVQWYAVRLD
jgi:hypothetical protein